MSDLNQQEAMQKLDAWLNSKMDYPVATNAWVKMKDQKNGKAL